MSWFRKKKIEEKREEVVPGLFLGEGKTMQQSRRFLTCMPKGLLCFLIVFGSFGGFLSAFEMECNYVVAALVLFGFAMYFSFLFSFQKNSRKDLGYIVFFIVYVFGIMAFKAYVNSGFAAIVNVVKQRAEVYFGLNTGTEFAEQIEDRSLSITMTFIFVAIFLILTLNIFLSNYMNLKLPLFICIPMYVIPLYFRQEPGLFFVLCLCGGFLGIHMLKNGRRHRIEKNGAVYRGILLLSLAIVLVVGGFSLVFPEEKNREIYRENPYKTVTKDAVSGFVMMGFWSFFPNPASRGGMSGGKLGDFSMLRPDNQTDLIVRFAPYTTEPLYLKGYTGLSYENSEWQDGYQIMGTLPGHSQYFYTESMKNEADALAKNHKKQPQKEAKAKIEIENVGADVNYVYYPYFTKFDNYKKYSESQKKVYTANPLGTTNVLTFYPNLTKEAKIEDADSYIYHQIPEINMATIDACIHEMGLIPGINYAEKPEVINQVISYFRENFSYSYRPGKLPEGEDFVDYFLRENRKGVCMHFASAATLVLRRLGIASRYVEGYAVGYGDILKGKLREDLDYEDYYEGPSALGKTGVMEVELTDANAHAWVEVYQPQRGWIVVDPTPTNMSENTDSDFWTSVKNFIEDSPQITLGDAFSNFGTSLISNGIIPIFLGISIILAVVFLLLRKLYLAWKRYRSWHTKDAGKNLLCYMEMRTRHLAKKDVAFASLTMPSDKFGYLAKKAGTSATTATTKATSITTTTETTSTTIAGTANSANLLERIDLFEKICFSPYVPSLEEYEQMLQWIKELT